jgi:hypothetical protein
LYFSHSIAVHVETVEELKMYPGFTVKNVVYLQSNPFVEVTRLDKHRLHRAGVNDVDRFTWNYLTDWMFESRKYPRNQVYQYSNITIDVLEDIFHLVSSNRADVTKINCAKDFVIKDHPLINPRVTPGQRKAWCEEFKTIWNETIYGPCMLT